MSSMDMPRASKGHALLRAEALLIHFGIDSEAAEAEDHEASGDGDDEGREKDG